MPNARTAAAADVPPAPPSPALPLSPQPATRLWQRAETLAHYRSSIPSLTLAERRQVVDAASVLLAEYYVHLPQKRATHGLDPVTRLRALRRRLPWMDSGLAFHTAMAELLGSLADLHTNYLLPAAQAYAVAFLPFQLGEYASASRQRVIVTQVAPGFAELRPGDEVIAWSGVPILRAVERAAERTAGANPAAQRANALAAMTLRPLIKRPPPDEDWVFVRVRSPGAPSLPGVRGVAAPARQREIRVDWRVLTLPARDERRAASLDVQVDALRRIRRRLFGSPQRGLKPRSQPGQQQSRYGASVGGTTTGGARLLRQPVATGMSRILSAAELHVGGGRNGGGTGLHLGYLRVHTFLAEPDEFLAEFVRLLDLLPRRGLVLDVRDNGGGMIDTAERTLQLLTPRKIEPAPMQLRATTAVLALCQGQGPSNPDRVADLSAWEPSVAHALETGAPYSAALPMTDPAACNDLGQHYHGPVVLLTSALCYSATDIFAAGFQDHGIGPVLGVHSCTGAGGANVWPLAMLREAVVPAGNGEDAAATPPPPLPRDALPHGAELRVALRRSLRVGPNAGLELEERGVIPDVVHDLTRRDLLEGDPDLLAHAARLIAARPVRQLDLAMEGADCVVRLRGADRLDASLDGRPQWSRDVAAARAGTTVRFTRPSGAGQRLELRAYAGGALVAARVGSLG